MIQGLQWPSGIPELPGTGPCTQNRTFQVHALPAADTSPSSRLSGFPARGWQVSPHTTHPSMAALLSESTPKT